MNTKKNIKLGLLMLGGIAAAGVVNAVWLRQNINDVADFAEACREVFARGEELGIYSEEIPTFYQDPRRLQHQAHQLPAEVGNFMGRENIRFVRIIPTAPDRAAVEIQRDNGGIDLRDYIWRDDHRRFHTINIDRNSPGGWNFDFDNLREFRVYP